jgi:glutamate carboxypeptidase
MKAGIVLLVEALAALDAAGTLDDARIVVFLTGDEENVGRPFEHSRGPLVAAARESDRILSFEATVRNTATVGRRDTRDRSSPRPWGAAPCSRPRGSWTRFTKRSAGRST